MSLMLQFSKDQFAEIYKAKCSTDPNSTDAFYLDFNLEVGSRSIAKAAVDTIAEIQHEAKIGIFEYLLIETNFIL